MHNVFGVFGVFGFAETPPTLPRGLIIVYLVY